jgi:hypothetical protein
MTYQKSTIVSGDVRIRRGNDNKHWSLERVAVPLTFLSDSRGGANLP